MLLSKLVCTTTKETPADVKIISHIMLARAGFIKPVSTGIYSLSMPAQKMALKIENIIREEMDAIDGQEVKFPVVMPRELWEGSGRYESIGSEMVRFKDRNDHDMLLGMTHEEAAVHLAKNTLSSYNQLPCMIYQIQTKFRDEPRARGGLIRVREFTMKDAYSFHMTNEDLEKYYDRVYEAYFRIFRRIGLKNFIAVKSDTGMMGGSVAHEYMLLTDDGEDELVLCDSCGYKSNMEVADSVITKNEGADAPLEEVYTGEAHDIEEVCNLLKIEAKDTVKAVVYAIKGESGTVVCFIRGDLEVNESKLKKVIGKNIVPYDARGDARLCAGNIGVLGLEIEDCIKVYDKSLEGAKGMVTGANKAEYHLVGLNFDRDMAVISFHDIKKARQGDLCPVCGKPLNIQNGIEIGNIFQLGTKYTKSMNMTVTNDKGEAVNPIMGCYGIGVGRAIASIAQESIDEKGMILPISVAPWQIHICALRYDDSEVKRVCDEVYNNLLARGYEVLLDDRDLSAGVKFADADLFGMPIRMVISPKSIKNGTVEVKLRGEKESSNIVFDELYEKIDEIVSSLREQYKQ